MTNNDTVENVKDDSGNEGVLKVSLALLDRLMNLAGELVLSRNQMLQGIGASDMKAIEIAGQRIDMITSELQETVMRTRMQPIGTVLDRFSEKIDGLSKTHGKKVAFTVEGREVELDKTILEAITDPMLLMVTHSVENQVESPSDREIFGKNPEGKISIRVSQDAGEVSIVISDDGRGAPMDEILRVVTGSIEDLGGGVESNIVPSEGCRVQIKLPLTLAIIPSQIICVGEEQFAVPQVNLNELIRIPAAMAKEKIEIVGDAEVVRLRGELLPLLDLAEVLGIRKTYEDPSTGQAATERRKNLADRRSKKYREAGDAKAMEVHAPDEAWTERSESDRRINPASAIHVAVVSAGPYKYGLVVGALKDSEEIVVKPVGRHLKQYTEYAGATIMGDGKVALILDILNLAQKASLSAAGNGSVLTESAEDTGTDNQKETLLTFRSGENEHFAVPMEFVERVERIEPSRVESVAGGKVIQYQGRAMPVFELSQVMDIPPLPDRESLEVIVLRAGGKEFGVMVIPPTDAVEVVMALDEGALKSDWAKGSIVIEDHTTLLLEVNALSEILAGGERMAP